jgi:hypothetical protein
MSSLPERQLNKIPDLSILHADNLVQEERMSPSDVIEDYLDHLCAPLVGVVPYQERFRLREETGFHLERRARGFMLDGMNEADAVLQAIERYGTSQEIGQRFLEAWFTAQPRGPLAQRLGLANAYALVPFGQATVICLVLLQLRVFLMPTPQPYMFGLSLADIRHVIPEPLPLPETNWESLLLYLVAFLAPFVAGWITGTRAPVDSARAVYRVQTIFTLLTFVVGVMMLPTREGVSLALFQLFFWLPVGCAVAHVSGLMAWRRRCQRFVAPRMMV